MHYCYHSDSLTSYKMKQAHFDMKDIMLGKNDVNWKIISNMLNIKLWIFINSLNYLTKQSLILNLDISSSFFFYK